MTASDWLASASWYHALTLAERNALRSVHADAQLPEGSLARGQRILDRWRAQPPFATDPYFAQRLAAWDIDADRLSALLGEPAEALRARSSQPPAWLTKVVEAYMRPLQAPDSSWADETTNDDLMGDDLTDDETPFDDRAPDETTPDDAIDLAEFGFLELAQPLIDQACDRLQTGIAALAAQWESLPFDLETIENVLLANLPDPLLMRLSRTLVLELNVARLQGLLTGDTSQARFESFVERLADPEIALALLADYPVLARQLTICLDLWTEVSLEFLSRLCADWDIIRRTFSPNDDPGLLIEVVGGAGDTHRGGRSVMIAGFESGFRLVYKPKSMAVDEHFQELLAWLNRLGCNPSLYILTILDRMEYGWVEFVTRRGCDTPDEVARFYQRHGAYLALLYALNSNDFHYENLIAVGEHPVLIDLETVLQPLFDIVDETRAEMVADKSIVDSVLQTNLLPLRMWSSVDYVGIDISGLGGVSGQLSPDRLPQPTDTGTDAMRYVRQRVELAGESHRPTLQDAEVDAISYMQDVVNGFIHMTRLLIEHHAELIAPDGPLARFAQDEIRVLLRPTRTYDQLLSESFHPDMLHDALERDRFLDRLWLSATERAYLARVIHSEQVDLQQGDIPIFTTQPNSLNLIGGSGEVIEGVLYEIGMTAVRRRLEQIDERDVQRQAWFIRASFATLAADRKEHALSSAPLPEAAPPVSRDRLLAGVHTIADYLVATAIHGAEDASWVGLELLDNQTWAIRPLGLDLYAGVPGAALFLALAGAALQDERYTALARRGVNTLIWQADLLADDMLKIGGFYGWGGALYTLTRLSLLWEDAALLAKAAELVDILATHISQDDEYDVARGSAGAILSLLALHRHSASGRGMEDGVSAHALEVAATCGEHLLQAAQPSDHGLSWALPSYGTTPLVGFAHGIAGIAYALLELAAVTERADFHTAAQQALAQALSLDASPPKFLPSADAYAAALQIGLARECLSRSLDTPQIADALRAGLHEAQYAEGARSHALMQGAMGGLDLLMSASRKLNDAALQQQAGSLAASLLSSSEQAGWRCGAPQAVEIPGLMLGLSGIGYQLLRLADPEGIPSVLVLDLPMTVPTRSEVRRTSRVSD